MSVSWLGMLTLACMDMISYLMLACLTRIVLAEYFQKVSGHTCSHRAGFAMTLTWSCNSIVHIQLPPSAGYVGK